MGLRPEFNFGGLLSLQSCILPLLLRADSSPSLLNNPQGMFSQAQGVGQEGSWTSTFLVAL